MHSKSTQKWLSSHNAHASLLSCAMQTMWLLHAVCFLTYCVFQMKHRHLPHNICHRLLVTTHNTYFKINNCISFMEAIHGLQKKRAKVILRMNTVHNYIPHNVLSFLWSKGHIFIYHYNKHVFF